MTGENRNANARADVAAAADALRAATFSTSASLVDRATAAVAADPM